jgi:Uma2 family endonuclease
MTLVTKNKALRVAPQGEPVWAIAEFFPDQGRWSEGEYLALPTRRLVEFDNGTIEFPPMPTRTHQLIALLLYELLKASVARTAAPGWLVLVAPYKLRIPTGKFREPDVIYLTPEQNAQANEDFALAAEVVMEVVSPDEPSRDYVTKRADYAAAGVPEYWIVDKDLRQVLVLRLEDGAYVEHGTFGPGDRATSHRLPGLAVAVDDVLAAGR